MTWRGDGRFEFKFVLPVTERERVLDLIAPHVRPDPHCRRLDGGVVGYRVHSLYLDTPELKDYYERLERRRVRNRLRVRTYGRPGEGQPVFLENKRKSRKWVVKHRVRVGDADSWCASPDPRPWVELARCVNGGRSFAATSFLRLVEGGGRGPVSAVTYLREVFVPREDDGTYVRLNLDHDVCAAATCCAHDLYGGREIALIPPGWMVMELKFERRAPGWMLRLRSDLGVTAVPVSKFGLSVALGLHQDRPVELRSLTPPPLRGWV